MKACHTCSGMAGKEVPYDTVKYREVDERSKEDICYF